MPTTSITLKNKSNYQISLDIENQDDIIALYDLFTKQLGGETGIYIILNILEKLDIKSLVYFIYTSFIQQFCDSRGDTALARIVMNKMITPCKIKFMKKVMRRKELYKEKCPKGKPFIVACEFGNLNDVKLFIAAHDEKVTGVTVNQLINQLGQSSDGYFFTPLKNIGSKQLINYLVY